jgi:hypothetical protein
MATAERAVKFVFLGDDKTAGRTMDQLARKSDTLGSRLSGFGKTAAIALGTVAAGGVFALGAAFTQGVKDAASFEVLTRKTAAVIASTGNVAHISVDGVKALAASLESMSGVDEELIINSQNVLATFTKVRNEVGRGNDIFDQGTRAALNMSVALGTDLASSTIMVGKALNDPIRGITALRRAGVQLTTAQEDQIRAFTEAGDVMSAQKIILGELETQFGGVAEAAGDTFTGRVARAKDAFGDLFREIATRALPVLGDVADWVSTTGIPKLDDFANFVSDDLVPTISDAFGTVKDVITNALPDIDLSGIDVTGALPDIDLSGIGANIAEQAKGWGSDIIDGVQTGLEEDDWGPLGETVGNGLLEALKSAGRFAADIGRAIAGWLSSVDWLGIGIEVGKQAVPFFVGLVLGFLNFDLAGLLAGLAEHWQEVLLGILALALAPAKWITAIANLLRRIPFVGRLLGWLLEGMASVARSVVGAVTGFLGRFFGAFANGLTGGAAGKAMAAFTGWLGRLPTAIGVAALDVIAAAGRMMAGLGNRIVGFAGFIGRVIGQVIGWLTAPFRAAGSWLVNAGANFIAGLKGGVLGGISGIGRWLSRNVIAPVTGAFGRAGSWLVGAGSQLISGLRAGILNTLKNIGTWVKRNVVDPVVNAVKRFFGIKSPSTVFASIGVNMIQGLLKGLSTSNGLDIAKKVFGGLPNALAAFVGKGLIAVGSLPRKALDALGGLSSAAWDALGGVGDAAMNALGSVGGAVGDLWGQISGLFGGGGDAPAAAAVGGGVKGLVRDLAARMYGWTGAQWNALHALIMGESGFRPNAQNPTSTAYGLFQFLDSTWSTVGGRKTSDPHLQTVYGLRYIAQRYGTPAAAYGAWSSRSPHWYDTGGVIEPGVFTGLNATGRNEYILTDAQMKALGPGGAGIHIGQLIVQQPFGGTRQETENGLVEALTSLDRKGRISIRSR